MMEALSASETSVNFYQTILRNIPEDCHLHTRRRENLELLLNAVPYRYFFSPMLRNSAFVIIPPLASLLVCCKESDLRGGAVVNMDVLLILLIPCFKRPCEKSIEWKC
jgi:hypothetical protein